ncbi:MAG: DUF523 domain-containing protein [Clostridia bacterium]|nr:DUF523 domain-containing protein [Clostridia bacterium]
MILVSSCLLGIRSKYDGSINAVDRLIESCKSGLIIPVCPEQLGGSPTPRPPAEIRGGTGVDVLAGRVRVFTSQGDDLTELFIDGAREVLKICRLFGVQAAILKERSPSCGVNVIYEGSFQGIRVKGRGVTAALLASEGIPVYSEEDLTTELITALFKAAGPQSTTEGSENK